MEFKYFYGQEAQLFSFFRVPKVLYTEETFATLSSDAKILYSILLDRMSLSARNNWIDEEGRVFIIFTIQEVKTNIRCSERKSVQLMNELEKFGLIERKRQGLCKPNLVYVKNFVSVLQKVHLRTCKICTSEDAYPADPDLQDMHSNNTNINNTDLSDTDTIHLSEKAMERWEECRQYFIKRLEMEALICEYPYDEESLLEILELLVDIVCSDSTSVRIGCEMKDGSLVRSQFKKLSKEHISYVLMSMKENTAKIKNIRAYLLTALFYAPFTISNYYTALVNSDMANGVI